MNDKQNSKSQLKRISVLSGKSLPLLDEAGKQIGRVEDGVVKINDPNAIRLIKSQVPVRSREEVNKALDSWHDTIQWDECPDSEVTLVKRDSSTNGRQVPRLRPPNKPTMADCSCDWRVLDWLSN